MGSDMQSKRSPLSAIKYDHQLWNHPERWPHDPPNYVFLARAFREMGRARYGDQWTDSCIEPEEPPEDCDDAADEQYDRDCERAKMKFENMYASIARTIAEQSGLGNLATALRHSAGGKMNGLEPYVWNTENVGTRFFRCQMSLDRPFQDPARVRFEPLYWIYVTRGSLDRYVGGGSAARPAANSLKMGQSKPKGRPGRRPGSGSYDVADRPLLEEMHRLFTSGVAKSPHDAARRLADKAAGGRMTTVESKQTRLAKGYRKIYPSGAK
ncbi:MAG: hypothetical protein ACLPTQ_04280 [Terriglobales bacterium]